MNIPLTLSLPKVAALRGQTQQKDIVLRKTNAPVKTQVKNPATEKKQWRVALAVPRPIHPTLLRAALNELDNILVAKGGVLVPQSHPQYEVCRQKALSVLSESDKEAYSKYRGELVKSAFGTVMPAIKCQLVDIAVTPTAGVLTTVYSVEYGNVNDNSLFTSMFDEYMFVKAKMEWIPYRQAGFSTSGSIAMAIGVVDYVDATALSSSAQAFSFDTRRFFYLENPGKPYREEWPMRFLDPPDEEWNQTGTSPDMGYLKLYAWQGVGGSTTYGTIHGYCTLRFRQKHA